MQPSMQIHTRINHLGLVHVVRAPGLNLMQNAKMLRPDIYHVPGWGERWLR